MIRLFSILLLLFCAVGVNAQQTIFTPTCAGVNDTARFTTIIATIGANQGTINLPYKVGSRCAVNSLTVPANITLNNTTGTGIKINTGQTLTVVGPVISAPKLLFANATAGLGTISFSGNRTVGLVKPEWWGAVSDGVTDDAPEFNAAVLATMSGIELVGPNYALASSVLIENRVGFTVRGQGQSSTSGQGTQLTWTGNSTAPMFRVFGVRDADFKGFYVKSSSVTPLAIVFQSETRSGIPSTNNWYHEIVVQGTDLNGLGRVFKFITGTGGDANNAENIFGPHLTLNNYTNYAFDFQHGQSTAHRFYAIGANSAPGAAASAAINSVAGVTYQIYGANLNGNTEADIIWGGANHGLTLIGVFAETSVRFLKTSVAPSTNAPVKIIGGSWNTANLHADGRVIDFQQRGPLTIEGWAMVGSTATAAAIYFDAGANGTWNFTIKGCALTTSLSSITTFTGDQPGTIEHTAFLGATTEIITYKSNNPASTPSFATLGVGTADNADPTPAILLVDGRQRTRTGGGTTRYRADSLVTSAGLAFTVFDDTAAIYKPFIVSSSTFEVWPGAVQANRVQVDANGNLQVVAAAGTVITPLLQVGGGTAISQIKTYAASLTPVAVAANTSAEQTFTVAGLTTADKVTINGPAPTAGTGIVNARVSAVDTLALTFGNFTAGSLTPIAGTYSIVAIRN